MVIFCCYENFPPSNAAKEKLADKNKRLKTLWNVSLQTIQWFLWLMRFSAEKKSRLVWYMNKHVFMLPEI